MPERLEQSAGRFWWETCGIDNGWRNAHLHDTPWTGFTTDGSNILVCTLWEDGIVQVNDSQRGNVRRFVRMGDYLQTWHSTLRTKGRAAQENIERALAEKKRFIGFEIKRRQNAPTAQIEHFYMDRYHKLDWLPAVRVDVTRLNLDAAFRNRNLPAPPNVAGNTVGHYFELLPWTDPVPGRDSDRVAPGAVRHVPPAPMAQPATDVIPVIATTTPAEPEKPAEPPPWLTGWGGGESEHHKALKEYVAAHPEQFGVPPGAEAIQEFLLLSGDRLDVMFQTPTEWIGIEVKSAISGFDDCQRGVFQVIKYRALMKAQTAWLTPDAPRAVRVMLVLEGELPGQLEPLVKRFNCEVREKVKLAALPPDSRFEITALPTSATA